MNKMRDALRALGKGSYLEPSDKGLYVWCKEWYELYEAPKIRTNTKSKYFYALKRLEKYDIAVIPLKSLSTEHIQKQYNKNIGKYSIATIKIDHALINGALTRAEQSN